MTSSNVYIQLRLPRNVTIASLVSVLVHILILFLLSYFDLLKPHSQTAEQSQPLDVELQLPQENAQPIKQPPLPPRLAQAPKIKPKITKPSPTPKETIPLPATPPPIASTQLPAPQAAPLPVKPAPQSTEQFSDLASYQAAQKERRRLAGDPSALNEEAAARNRGPTEDEIRMANLNRNVQPPGTNGIFNILSMDNRSVTFDFRGWKNELSYAHREVYQVEADRNTDVQHAMVRKMIEIIRRYYNGDFNWQSQRLRQVVVLSARPQDNDFLEEFLLKEFFGIRGIVPQ